MRDLIQRIHVMLLRMRPLVDRVSTSELRALGSVGASPTVQ